MDAAEGMDHERLDSYYFLWFTVFLFFIFR